MSSDDGELDRLKAVVIGTLKAQGVLGKLQAELRHHVFAALASQQQSEQQPLQSPDSPPRASSASSVSGLQSGIEGRLLLELVQEYLSFHQLHQTLSVLRLETALSPAASSSSLPAPPDRLSLSRSLHLPVSSSPHHSLLHSLYLSAQHSRPSSPLLSPRSEDRLLPLSHPSASQHSRRGEEDLTPPISPRSSPPAHDTTTSSLSTSSSSAAGLDDAEAEYAADALSDADWAHRYNYVESVRSL